MNARVRGSLVVALVLLVLLGVGHLFVPFAPDADKIPSLVRYGDVALGVVSLIAAFGLLRRAQWGRVLTLVVASLNVLSAAPGVVAAPNAALQVIAAVYVVLSLAMLALVWFSAERQASVSSVSAARE